MENGHFSKVTLVAPYSPSWKSGLFAGDDIIAINGIMLKNNFHHWLSYYAQNDEIILTVNSNDLLKTIPLQKDKKENSYFFNPVLKLGSDVKPANTKALRAWQEF